MFDFVILTPTYNRSTEFKLIAAQLTAELHRINMTALHCILDDGSESYHNYKKVAQDLQTKKYRIICKRHARNLGRDNFWRTWDTLIKMARPEKWKYCIAIPDDHILCSKFLKRISSDFEALKKQDRLAIAMNILVNSKRNWNMNRFIDGAFICDRKLFDCIGWSIAPIHSSWFEQVSSKSFRTCPPSSGVWKQISQRISKNQNWRIGAVKNISYLKPMDCNSAMFPKSKFPNRPKVWGLNNFIDKEEE